MAEQDIEPNLTASLTELKCNYRADITSYAALERDFLEKFEALNRVKLTDNEFARLLDEITTPDFFAAAKILLNLNAFSREEGTPLSLFAREALDNPVDPRDNGSVIARGGWVHGR